jgi:ATP-dependent Clp protease protease subunit
LHQARQGTQGQATDIQIRAKEVLDNRKTMLDILARNTGQSVDRIEQDTDRMLYLTPERAKEYGLIDTILTSRKDLPTPVPSLT